MKRMTVAILALWTAGAWAEDGPLTLRPAPFQLPRTLGPLTTDGAAHEFGDPRLGVSYQYSAPGASLTVYVYNAGVTDLKDGPDTRAACEQFEIAKQSVVGSYRDVRLVSEQMSRLLPPKDAPLIREAVFDLNKDGFTAVSFVWVTAAAGNFLKLRFTISTELKDELPEARRAILSAVGTALEPHLAPPDPAAKPRGTSINVGSGANEDDMSAGLMYLMILSAAAQKTPESVPVCGGALSPAFATEVGIQRAVFLESQGLASGSYAKRLAQIDQAGFLDEFIWTEWHRESWGETAPDGLQLSEYAAWKKKKLKRFRRPEFGAVVVDYPRPLPLEPAPPTEGAIK